MSGIAAGAASFPITDDAIPDGHDWTGLTAHDVHDAVTVAMTGSGQPITAHRTPWLKSPAIAAHYRK
jgi:hypothetical protein